MGFERNPEEGTPFLPREGGRGLGRRGDDCDGAWKWGSSAEPAVPGRGWGRTPAGPPQRPLGAVAGGVQGPHVAGRAGRKRAGMGPFRWRPAAGEPDGLY